MNSLVHQKNVKQFNSMIDSYEKKLDEKVNQMFNHIINLSCNINDASLPVIENKRISSQHTNNFHSSNKRKSRTHSIGSASFVINTNLSNVQQNTEADHLFKTFKSKVEKQQKEKKSQSIVPVPIGQRSIGNQSYIKPRLIKKKPQILSKEMRWDPFFDKNAIKAQQLNQGMLSLIERGKVGKNIDIITAFEKGRPILQTHQAIFHHAQQKFTDSDLMKSQLNPSQKTLKKQVINTQASPSGRKKLMQMDEDRVQYHISNASGWALTMPEDINTHHNFESSSSNLIGMEGDIETHCIKFLHYKVVKNNSLLQMKKVPQYFQQWGEMLQIICEIEKMLRKYNVQIVYCIGNKLFQLSKKRQSLNRLKVNEIQKCFVKPKNEKKKILSIKSIVNQQLKKNQASSILASAFSYALIRNKYMDVLKRKKYEKKVKQWILNGMIIKDYRKQLEVAKKQILEKFSDQQRHFKTNLLSMQQKKHYEIHIVNRPYMNKFKFYEQFCSTEITRIFNLENNNTNIIYVSPFQLNIETINYYFKIMQLEEIDNYIERVTFLQLEDITSKIKLPPTMNTSQKLYFNSKALRKLKRKIQGFPAYFVTNYPSEIDIKLSVFLGVPIYSGDFHRINPVRSALFSQRLLFQGVQPTPSFPIEPKQYNIFQLSMAMIRYFEANKKNRKYVLKINGYNFSSGIALLTYPFTSLPEMYSNTALVQPYYFKSIQKFYSEFAKNGGVVQKYEQGTKTITLSAKVLHGEQHAVLGTFQRISNGFVNIGYIFPQKCVPHKTLVAKSNQILQRLSTFGHVGYVELTFVVTLEQQLFLEQVELYSTKITNSLFYFKFLAGGYMNHLGQFMTKVSPEGQQPQDQQITSMQSRSYCYIPFILHFGLTEKQTSSFFQLCRIGGVSFDLQSKFGTTFIILGSLKDTIGIITTAKDRKSMLKLIAKSTDFLIKQNSHNISPQMLKQKEERVKQRFNIAAIKDRIEQI